MKELFYFSAIFIMKHLLPNRRNQHLLSCRSVVPARFAPEAALRDPPGGLRRGSQGGPAQGASCQWRVLLLLSGGPMYLSVGLIRFGRKQAGNDTTPTCAGAAESGGVCM